MTNIIKQIKTFILDSYEELKRVTWLSKKEVVASTIAIIIIVILASVYIGFVDFLLSKTLGIFLIR